MLRLARTILFCVVVFALAAGYLSSQSAYLGGTASDYAKAVDTPLIQWLSLIVLLKALAWPFIKNKEGGQD